MKNIRKKYDVPLEEIERRNLPQIYNEPTIYREIIETYIRLSNVILEEATLTLRTTCKIWKKYIEEQVSPPHLQT